MVTDSVTRFRNLKPFGRLFKTCGDNFGSFLFKSDFTISRWLFLQQQTYHAAFCINLLFVLR